MRLKPSKLNTRGSCTNPPSCDESRFKVTLDVPQAVEESILYLDRGRVYSLTIQEQIKAQPELVFSQYHTVVRVSSVGGPPWRNTLVSQYERLNSHVNTELYQHDADPLAFECVGVNFALCKEILPGIRTYTHSPNAFSIMWSTDPSVPVAACSVLIRFDFVSADLVLNEPNESKCAVRLHTETTLSAKSVPYTRLTETWSSVIRVFEVRGAAREVDKRERLRIMARIKKRDNERRQRIELRRAKSMSLAAGRKKDDLPTESTPSNFAGEDVDKVRIESLSDRPSNVSRSKANELGVCDERPEWNGPSTRSPVSDDNFWTGRPSRSSASIKSQSSERNSSLHGSGRPDAEDQDLSFGEDGSSRESASFSESSAHFPPPPKSFECGRLREMAPHDEIEPDDGIKPDVEITGNAIATLCTFCDICEQDVRIMRRRDWQ